MDLSSPWLFSFNYSSILQALGTLTPFKSSSRDFSRFSRSASDRLANFGSCDRQNYPSLVEVCNRKGGSQMGMYLDGALNLCISSFLPFVSFISRVFDVHEHYLCEDVRVGRSSSSESTS